MTCTDPVRFGTPGDRFSSPSPVSGQSGPLVQGAARMGRERDNNANRARVCLYIVKRRFQKVRNFSTGGLRGNEK